jgi:hypothetical protein
MSGVLYGVATVLLVDDDAIHPEFRNDRQLFF